MKKSRQDVIICADFENINDLRSSLDNKFHYFYKILNTVNNKFYYGIHTTDNIFDGYSGSGSILKSVYNKYGKFNCIKYIERFFEDRKSLMNYEKYIVNESVINDDNCYNTILGGSGAYEIKPYKTNYDHNKLKIHINNGYKNKLIYPKELDQYLKDGWKIGETHSSTKGKIVINNGITDRFIYEEELDQYLKDGWIKGGKTRNKNQKSFAKNTIWINNRKKQIRISKSLIDNYLKDGWEVGIIQNTTKGYIRITNGKNNKNIHPTNTEELNYYLSLGWKKGSAAKSNFGKKWINNDKTSILVNINELNYYLNLGWKIGRLKNPKIS